MTGRPRIIVHNLAQAEAALRASVETRVPITLSSPPDAARSWGAPYFLALIDAAREAVPEAEFDSVLDCGAAAGLAMDALRRGAKIIRLRGDKKVFDGVTDIAEQLGARVERADKPANAFDLCNTRDPYAAALQYIAER